MTGSLEATVQALADRAEIDDLLTRYSYAVDGREFDRLDTVFTPDAQIDSGTRSPVVAGPRPFQAQDASQAATTCGCGRGADASAGPCRRRSARSP